MYLSDTVLAGPARDSLQDEKEAEEDSYDYLYGEGEEEKEEDEDEDEEEEDEEVETRKQQQQHHRRCQYQDNLCCDPFHGWEYENDDGSLEHNPIPELVATPWTVAKGRKSASAAVAPP